MVKHICEEWSLSSEYEAELLLQHGRCIILLDGLDEVPGAQGTEVVSHIRKFSETYYKNQIVVSCRINAQDYSLDNFTYVEIADFSPDQVKAFVKNYFMAAIPGLERKKLLQVKELLAKIITVSSDADILNLLDQEFDNISQQLANQKHFKNKSDYGLIKSVITAIEKSNIFLNNLENPDNHAIKDLVVTPILLSLACSVFLKKGKFYSQPSKLYREGLGLLLSRWDRTKGVERDTSYGNLSIIQKTDLLSFIAAHKFEKSQYILFDEDELKEYINRYFDSIGVGEKFTELYNDISSETLKSIEAQHGLLIERASGIYSFSHLTFQEYFVARTFANKPDASKLALLAHHVLERKWWEVLRLTISAPDSSDELLLLVKQEIDELIFTKPKLKELLRWVSIQADVMKSKHNLASIRAFLLYCNITLNFVFTSQIRYWVKPPLARAIDKDFDYNTEDRNFWVDINLMIAYVRAYIGAWWTHPHKKNVSPYLGCEFVEKVLNNQNVAIDDRFRLELEKLIQQIPDWGKDAIKHKEWWSNREKFEDWVRQLGHIILKNRDIARDWQLTEKEKKLIGFYYDANLLLLKCMNLANDVKSSVKQKIIKEIIIPDGLR